MRGFSMTSLFQKPLPAMSMRDVSVPVMPLRDTSVQIAEAVTRLSKLKGLKRRMGIVRLWPDQAVAEHENVERIRAAAALMDVEVLELDRNGFILDAPEGSMVTENDVDFVIHLHFETPKAYAVPSIAAMWNPINFYFDWGYDTYWANQMSHDIFAWTGSTEIESLIGQERGKAVAAAMPLFNHTLAEPIYEPRARRAMDIFYCGINWEKLSGKPGRHDAVLRGLDKAGKLALYGPEKVQGVNVWEGYKSYRGSLPFDGRTVIEKIAEAGACLVFSSDAHKSSGIMSNRLFEALSGGVVVIGDEHPFIKQAIGDNYVLVPSDLSSEKRTKLILDTIKDFEQNPEEAQAMAKRAQDAFVEKYFLCGQIANLYDAFDSYRTSQQQTLALVNKPLLDVVVQPCGMGGKDIVSKLTVLAQGLGDKGNIILVCDRKHVEWMERACGHLAKIVPSPEDHYAVLAPADAARLVEPYLRTDKLWLSTLTEELFFSQFLHAVAGFKDRYVGRLGHLLNHSDVHGKQYFDYRSGDLTVERFHVAARAAFVFDSKWLLSTVAPPQIGWRQYVRMAELQEQGIAYDQPSSLVIDLKAYEANAEAGYREKVAASDGDYASRVGAARNFVSDTCSIKTYIPRPVDYSLGKGALDVSSDATRTLSTILGSGWHTLERDLVWSSGATCDMWLRVPPSVASLHLHIQGNPHVASGLQTIDIFVNQVLVNTLPCKKGEGLVVDIDSTDRPWLSDQINQITLKASEVATPPQGSGDLRKLGLCLKRIEAK